MSMTDHDQNGVGLPPEGDAERKKLKKLGRKLLEEGADWSAIRNKCRDVCDELHKYERRRRNVLHETFGPMLAVCAAVVADPALLKDLQKEAKKLNISYTSATSIALLVVKVSNKGRLDPATASLRAQALRGAALKGISPSDLPAYLKKNGGYVHLAEYFTATQEARQDDGEQAGGHTRALSNEKRRSSGRLPSLTWRKGTSSIWEEAAQKNRHIELTVKPNDTNSGEVLKARILSKKEKGREVRHGS